MFSSPETFISIGHLSGFMMMTNNRKVGFILQNFAVCFFLLKKLTYIKIMGVSHSFRSYSAKSKLDVFCEIKKLPITSSEIWNSLHLLSK